MFKKKTIYILIILSYFGLIMDLACVSPNGESFGRLMKIKTYAMMLTKKLMIITVERLNPLNFLSFDFGDLRPKKLQSKPPNTNIK